MFSRKEYKVLLNGRAGITYKEKSLIVHIDSEMINSPNFDMVVFLENFANWKIEGCRELETEKIQKIKSLVKHELRKIRVDWQ